MKGFLYIFILVTFIICLSSCQNRERNNKSENATGNDMPVKDESAQLDSLYWKIKTISLPFGYDDNYLTHPSRLVRLPESMYHLFYNYEKFDFDTRIAKLPDFNDFRVILIYYNDENKDAAIDLYSLSNEMKIIDRLQVLGIEKVNGNNIKQIYEISEDYLFKVSKLLDRTIIEELIYEIGNEGYFTEKRDGKTPVIAFESFDNINYIVENFIWDYDSNGGLYKKNLKTKYYRISGNGNVIETNGI